MVRIRYDAFYHMPPGRRLGEHIVLGENAVNCGRYWPDDCFHPNGLAVLKAQLADRHEIRPLSEPYTDGALFDADILLVMNPDYPLYPGTSPYRWTPQDVEALLRFLRRGGGVLLMINSFLSRPDYWEENFDVERVSLLLDRLGVAWDRNYMSPGDRLEEAQAGRFRIAYSQGGRVAGALPDQVQPLVTCGENVYGFEARVGAGRVAVVGDAGCISNGLMCFPGFQNAAFFTDLIEGLTPAWVADGCSCWDYRSYGSLSTAPSEQGLNEALFRSLRPEAQWSTSYHYRHLTWDEAGGTALGPEVWRNLPVELDGLAGASQLAARFNWLPLSGGKDGPAFSLDLRVHASKGPGATDLSIVGQAHTDRLAWEDLCEEPERMRPAGRIERVHAVYQIKLVLDAAGRPKCARWDQSERLFVRNPKSAHYGYEVLLGSRSGVIAPRAPA